MTATSHTQQPRSHTLSVLVLTLLTLPAASSPTRADNIDQELLKHAPKLLKYLEEKNCKNVGLLKFRVSTERKTSFSAGTLNSCLADRLETALILNDGIHDSKPIGIIHN